MESSFKLGRIAGIEIGVHYTLIFWGVAQLFGGNFLGGLWIAFIGWFLNNAAEATRQQQVLRENLRGVRVATLMDADPPVVDPRLSVQDFVFDHVLRRGERAVLIGEDGRLLGLVSITDVKELPQDQWASTPVGRIMTPTPLKTVAPDDGMDSALQQLVDGAHNQLPVVANGRLVGMLTRADVLRFLHLREALDIRDLPSRRPSAGGVPGREPTTAGR